MDRKKTVRWTLLGLLLLAAAAFGPPGTRAQEPNRVGLVVQMGDEGAAEVETRCIEFQEEQISGYDVLLRSGLALEVAVDAGVGAFVCGIGGEGCPATDCNCQFPPNYWSYWHLKDTWIYSYAGAGAHYVHSGDVEGWSWGAGTPPQVIPFDQICAPPATNTPTATATWTPSPTAQPTDTPPPAATPTKTPAPTAEPSDTPLPSATPSAITTLPPTAAAAAAVATKTAAPSRTRALSGAATPEADDTTTATIAAGIVPATATIAPTQAATVIQASATMIWTAQVPHTPSPTKMVPQSIASLAQASASGAAHSTAGSNPAAEAETESGRKPSAMLTLVSIGAGAAYLFFVLFLLLLAALFLVARARQN